MIYDTVMLAYEIEVLAVRLEELKDVVDVHVIVESTHTFRGVPRQPLWPTLAKRKDFAPFAGKVHWYELDLDPGNDPWAAERITRDHQAHAADAAGCLPHDWIIVADCDEIPSAAAVQRAISDGRPHVIETDMRYLTADLHCLTPPCYNQVILARRDVIDSANAKRYSPLGFQRITGGWQLSYMGGPERVAAKLEAYAHSEFDLDEIKSRQHVLDCIKTMRDPLGRFDLELTDDLPTCITEDPERFAPLLRDTWLP